MYWLIFRLDANILEVIPILSMIPDERFRARFEEIRVYLLQVSRDHHDTMVYYRRHWDECRGDEYSDCGCCDYYFEAAPDGTVIRQLQIYDNGMALQYHSDNIEDTFGGLADQSLNAADGFASHVITREEFERMWNRHDAGRS